MAKAPDRLRTCGVPTQKLKELHLQWRGGMHYNFLEPSIVNVA
jgi:hypothetical protein